MSDFSITEVHPLVPVKPASRLCANAYEQGGEFSRPAWTARSNCVRRDENGARSPAREGGYFGEIPALSNLRFASA